MPLFLVGDNDFKLQNLTQKMRKKNKKGED